MKNSYYDLVAQTFDFPQDGFSLKSNRLFFNDIDAEAQNHLSSIQQDLTVIEEEFRRHHKTDEFESFISDGNPMQVVDVLEIISFVYEWRNA
jgi:hypothetical protein